MQSPANRLLASLSSSLGGLIVWLSLIGLIEAVDGCSSIAPPSLLLDFEDCSLR